MISSHQSVGWSVGHPVTIKLLVRRSVYSFVQASPDMVDVYLFWLKMMTLRSLVSSVSPARIGRWFSITSSDSFFAIHHPCLGTKNLTGSRPLIWLTSHPILNHTRNEEIHAGLNIRGPTIFVIRITFLLGTPPFSDTHQIYPNIILLVIYPITSPFSYLQEKWW